MFASTRSRPGSAASRGDPHPHHVGLDSVGPERAIAWFPKAWPTARRTEVAGQAGVAADMLLLFTQVDRPPPGAWRDDLHRSEPQSAFRHIGATCGGKDWMIELRKGRYGLETGGEIRVFDTAASPPAMQTVIDTLSGWFPAVATAATDVEKSVEFFACGPARADLARRFTPAMRLAPRPLLRQMLPADSCEAFAAEIRERGMEGAEADVRRATARSDPLGPCGVQFASPR